MVNVKEKKKTKRKEKKKMKFGNSIIISNFDAMISFMHLHAAFCILRFSCTLLEKLKILI